MIQFRFTGNNSGAPPILAGGWKGVRNRKLRHGFRKVRDDNILRGMEAIAPAYRLFDSLPIVKKATQKILVFEKK